MGLYAYLWLFFVLSVFIYGVLVIIKYSKKKSMPAAQKKQFQKYLIQMSTKQTPKDKIIAYDVLYHKILLALGYQWTFGKILKEHPNEIGDINLVWELHKLRNKLVHELDTPSMIELEKKSSYFQKAVQNLLKEV